MRKQALGINPGVSHLFRRECNHRGVQSIKRKALEYFYIEDITLKILICRLNTACTSELDSLLMSAICSLLFHMRPPCCAGPEGIPSTLQPSFQWNISMRQPVSSLFFPIGLGYCAMHSGPKIHWNKFVGIIHSLRMWLYNSSLYPNP